MTHFKTTTPKLFARFFMEVPFEEVQKSIDLHESCHGAKEEIDVIFFEDIPGTVAKEIKEDTTAYKGYLDFCISDVAETGKRELMVKVVL